MKRYVAGSIILVSVFYLLYFSVSKIDEASINPELNPKSVVSEFWNASFYGNEDIVARLVTKPPQSFANPCASISDDFKSTTTVVPKIPDGLEEIEKKSKKEILVKSFSSFYNPDSEFFPVYWIAGLIEINKSHPSNLIIENESVFNDQSKVTVRYKNDTRFMKDLELIFFLKKEDTGWKIFEVIDKANSYTLINKSYGESTFTCENK